MSVKRLGPDGRVLSVDGEPMVAECYEEPIDVTDELARARARRVAREAARAGHPSAAPDNPESVTAANRCSCGETHIGLVARPGTWASTRCLLCGEFVDVRS